MTANGWDSDGAAGTPAGSESPDANSPEGASGAAAYQAASPPDATPGGLLPRLQVPGMEVRSSALDYMLGKRRRRLRSMGAVAASILVIGVVAVVTVAAHNGGKKAGSAQLTAAQIVQQATRQQNGLRSESATFTEHLSGQVTGNVTGTVELQRKPLLMAMNMSLAGGSEAMTIRAILTKRAMYLKLSSAAGLPSYLASKWLKIPLTGLSPSSVFAVLQQELQNENPNSQFAGLEAASHLRAAGTQIVGGVTTTRYNGSFAPSAAVKALPASERGALGQYLNLIKGNVAFSVWIDSSHYVRKFQETESTGNVTISLGCTYGSFNQPVKITLPPQRQVYSPPAAALND